MSSEKLSGRDRRVETFGLAGDVVTTSWASATGAAARENRKALLTYLHQRIERDHAAPFGSDAARVNGEGVDLDFLDLRAGK